MNRFERQLALPGMNEEKQQQLRSSPILIVGAGGLGCAVFDALIRAGAEHITLMDGDVVSVSNLHRQVLFTPADIHQNKAVTAVQKMKQSFGEMPNVLACNFFLNEENAASFIEAASLIMDCTDQAPARALIDCFAKQKNKPWIYASVHGYETQLAVFRPEEPHWNTLFSGTNEASPSCSEQGVWGMIPNALGYQQALEAVKLICNLPGQLQGELLHYNYVNHSPYRVRFAPKTELMNTEPTSVCNENLNASEINALLQEKKCRLVDVRQWHETLASPWPAERIPMDELYEKAAGWLRNEPLILICHSGYRSRIALETLKDEFQFTEVYHLKGGLVQC